MKKTAILVGAADAAGMRIAADLEARGWRVLPVAPGEAQTPPTEGADMLILNIDRESEDRATIRDTLEEEALLEEYEYSCVGVLRALHAFLPLLKGSAMKRICVVTTGEGSQSLCAATSGYGRRMARASLNMALKLLFNQLRPEGYSFRIYCKDEEAPGEYAAEFFSRDRAYEPENLPHSEEERLVLHDRFGAEMPW